MHETGGARYLHRKKGFRAVQGKQARITGLGLLEAFGAPSPDSQADGDGEESAEKVR